ncbi:MAG: DUF6236 family protein [Methanofollis sp.]|nr:DUF6236 family protein [Methanofollis sp.]
MRTALYYPDIAITNRQWIRQAVLYWDEIGSIVPEWTWNEHPYFEDENTEINQLREAHLYRPFLPEKLKRKYRSKLQDQFYTEFFERLDYFDQSYHFRDNRTFCPTYESKEMRVHLFDELEKRGLATRKLEGKSGAKISVSEIHQPIILIEKNTSDIYMSLLAEYFARNDRNITIPCTDRRQSADYAFASLDSTVGWNSAEIFFDRILPVPAENVSLDKIINFKEDYRSELLRFREQIDSLQPEVESITDPRSLRDFTIRCEEKIELGVRNLQEDLNDHAIETRWGTLSAIVDVPLPKWLGGLASAELLCSTNPYLLCALGGFAAVDAGIRVGKYRAKQNHKRSQIFRDSPYSYIYHAAESLT